MIDVRNKRVLVVGLGRSGRSAALCLRRQGAIVTVTDNKPPAAFKSVLPELLAQKIGLVLGTQPVERFLTHDLVVVSPGVPWDLPQLVATRERGIPIVPEVEVAGWLMDAPIVGITGSNGKTTTTALLGKMLEASGFPTFVGGNIGVALTSAVDLVKSDSIVVAELSSFQLEAIRDFRPHVAVLLNISPNHLDRHPTFEAYAQAKRQIFRNQQAEDYAILNADDPWVRSLAPALLSHKVFFSRLQEIPRGLFVSNGNVVYRMGHMERVLLETRDVRLRGAFNLEDVLGAAAAACVLGADFEAIRRAVREFKGVEHRLEYVREICGVEFYNNSKATSVDATVKSLEAFERGVHLIMGGKDKGAPYAPLLPLLKDRVREVLLIGAAADRIEQELDGAVDLVRAGTLDVAVNEAFQSARPGDVVLLAPACSSYDQFQDFEHRGRVFKELVEQLAERVDSGSEDWRWTTREAASQGAEVTAPVDVQSPALEPQERPQPKSDPAAEASEPVVEEPVKQVSAPVEEETAREAAPPAAVEFPPRELTLVYEVNADEYPAAEDVPPQDYSEPSEPTQPQEYAAPEDFDDAPLPYEGRAKEKGQAARGMAGRDSDRRRTKDGSSILDHPREKPGDRKKKPAASDSAPQPKLPGMD